MVALVRITVEMDDGGLCGDRLCLWVKGYFEINVHTCGQSLKKLYGWIAGAILYRADFRLDYAGTFG